MLYKLYDFICVQHLKGMDDSIKKVIAELDSILKKVKKWIKAVII